MTPPAVQPSPALAHIAPSQWPALVRGLLDAMQSERRLIDELIQLMARQREAVAADNLQDLDDSVFGVQRVLLTLGEARKRRRAMNARMGQPEEVPLKDLLDAMGPYATAELHAAREALQASARALTREVSTNRQVLREALSSNEEMVRTLAGAPATPRVGYGEGLGASESRGSYIFNRRA